MTAATNNSLEVVLSGSRDRFPETVDSVGDWSDLWTVDFAVVISLSCCIDMPQWTALVLSGTAYRRVSVKCSQ